MKKWKIDSAHSEVKFKVKHLLVSTVSGQFNKFDAEIEAPDETFDNSKVTFSADVEMCIRDRDLRCRYYQEKHN